MHCLNCVRMKLRSPIGELLLEACQNGVHQLQQVANDDTDFKADLSVSVEAVNDDCDSVNVHAMLCIDWLDVYFTRPKDVEIMELPTLCLSKWTARGSFKEAVWLTLAGNVSPGETISYGKLATMTGSPGAARAVGTVMAMNPIQLLIPCHRVIRSDQSIGEYASGTKNKVKDWLLKFEGICVSDKGFVIYDK